MLFEWNIQEIVNMRRYEESCIKNDVRFEERRSYEILLGLIIRLDQLLM